MLLVQAGQKAATLPPLSPFLRSFVSCVPRIVSCVPQERASSHRQARPDAEPATPLSRYYSAHAPKSKPHTARHTATLAQAPRAHPYACGTSMETHGAPLRQHVATSRTAPSNHHISYAASGLPAWPRPIIRGQALSIMPPGAGAAKVTDQYTSSPPLETSTDTQRRQNSPRLRASRCTLLRYERRAASHAARARRRPMPLRALLRAATAPLHGASSNLHLAPAPQPVVEALVEVGGHVLHVGQVGALQHLQLLCLKRGGARRGCGGAELAHGRSVRSVHAHSWCAVECMHPCPHGQLPIGADQGNAWRKAGAALPRTNPSRAGARTRAMAHVPPAQCHRRARTLRCRAPAAAGLRRAVTRQAAWL